MDLELNESSTSTKLKDHNDVDWSGKSSAMNLRRQSTYSISSTFHSNLVDHTISETAISVSKQRKEKARRQGLVPFTERFRIFEFLSLGSFNQGTTPGRVCTLFTFYFWSLILTDFSFCVLYIVERILLEVSGEIEEASSLPSSLTTRPYWLYVLLVVLSFVSLTYALLRLTKHTFRQYGFFSLVFYLFIDATTCGFFISTIFYTGGNYVYVPYYLRVWQLLAKLQFAFNAINASLGQRANYVVEDIILIVFTTIAFVYCGLCAVNWADNVFSSTTSLDMFNSFYFLIVTVSTVGYGDVTPQSWEGRAVVMAVIVLALFVIPTQISALTDTLRNQKEAGDSVSLFQTDHYVLFVSLKYDTPIVDALQNLIPETIQDFNKVVIMDVARPSGALSNMLLAPYFRARVKTLLGSAMSVSDLQRARVNQAKAVFLLTDKYDPQFQDADQQNALRAWSVQSFAPKVPLYVLNIEPTAYIKNASAVLSAVVHKQITLACHCLFRGLGTFLCNLWRHSDFIQDAKIPWMDMYCDGLSSDIHEMRVKESDVNKTFSELSLELYQTQMVTLIGVLARVRVPGNNGESIEKEHFLLNPISPQYDYVIQAGDIIFYVGSRPLKGDPSQAQPAKTPKELFRIKSNPPRVSFPLVFSPPDRHADQVARTISTSDFEQAVYIGYPNNPHDSGTVPECFLLKKPVTYEDAKLKSADHLKSHLIVFGDLADLFFFVCLLRSSHLRYCELFSIVFFSDILPTKKEWSYFDRFPFIYFMKGSSVNETDLKRCGLTTMRRACIVSRPRLWKNVEEEAMVDATCIMTTHHLLNLCGESQHKYVVTELVHRDNFTFIPPKLPSEVVASLPEGSDYLVSPAYASGRLISLSMLDSILFQTFFRPHLPQVVKLLCGLKSRDQYEMDDAMAVRHQRLCCIDLPDDIFENGGQMTFGELFRILLTEHGTTAVALYRDANKSLGNFDWNFVYNNPFCDTPLLFGDRVFVISSEQLNPLFQRAHKYQ